MSIDAISDEVKGDFRWVEKPTCRFRFPTMGACFQDPPKTTRSYFSISSACLDQCQLFLVVANLFKRCRGDASVRVDTAESVGKPSSHLFVMPGKELEGKRIIGVNGLGNSFEEAQSHARYLQEMSGGYEVSWVYCSSEAGLVDIALSGACLLGLLSPEASLIQSELIQFHLDHLDHPDAKCFISCHSRGAIDVRNALEGLPEAVRNRAIVVAVASPVVIPKNLCFDSFNYASKNDPVPHLATWIIAGLARHLTDEQYLALYEEHHRELIVLEPHPNESGLGHGYQEPVFQKIIQRHLEEFLNC